MRHALVPALRGSIASGPTHRTAPHRTAPHRTAPHRTAPHRTADDVIGDPATNHDFVTAAAQSAGASAAFVESLRGDTPKRAGFSFFLEELYTKKLYKKAPLHACSAGDRAKIL